MDASNRPPEGRKHGAARLFGHVRAHGFTENVMHPYVTADGAEAFTVVRMKHPTWRELPEDERARITAELGSLKPDDGGKIVRSMHLQGSRYVPKRPESLPDGWPLYGLDKVLNSADDVPVFVVEGEGCANALHKLDMVATTSGSASSDGGADWRPLAGRRVILWPDLDKPGAEYAERVRARLSALGAVCEVIDVDTLGLPEKGDAVDWIKANPSATAAEVLALPRMVIHATGGEARSDAPRPLPSALLPVLPLPLDALPGAFGDWIGDVSERSTCPPDYVALPMLVGAGMLLARHCAMRPKRRDSWAVIPNIWGCIVGPPGAMKSPAMKQGLFALDRMEQAARSDYMTAMQAFDADAAAEKLRAEVAAKSARAALVKDRDADVRHLLTPAEAIAAPAETRFLVTDATVEKLGEILADNPGGVVYARDELGSLFRTLAREEQAAARGFLLTAWDGGRYRFDRITRGTVEIPNARVAVIGSIQPGPLSAMVREASGTGDDGLLQRPLFAWPDQSGQWTDVDRFPNSTARNAVLTVFDQLRHAPPFACQQEAFPDGQPDGLPFVRLDDAAWELFLEWRGSLEAMTRDDATPPGLSAALSKYRKHTPALALIVHALDGGSGDVTGAAMLKALALSEYFESHTRRVFDSGRRPMIEAARAILWRLERGDLSAEGFTLRDVYRAGWSGLGDRATVADAVAMLGDYGHLDAERIDTQGRPSEVFVWRRSE